MKRVARPFIFFVLLTIGSVVFVYYNSLIPIDQHRLTTNKNGEEVAVLNSLEKEFVGHWYFSFVGKTLLNMIPKKNLEKEYWSLNENGVARYNKPTGKKHPSKYWQISQEDSILRIINFREQDTVKYKIYRIGEDYFETYKYPNKMHYEGARFITWKKYSE